MQTFSVALGCVLQMLLYMLPGFLVVKLKKLRPDQLPGLSSALVYICSPCLVVASFLKIDFSWTLFGKMWLVFGISLGLQLLFVALLLLIFRRHRRESAYRVMCIAGSMSNAGFFGLPLITAILPNAPEVAAYSCIFCVTMDAVVFTVGVYCYTQKTETISLKSFFFNPVIPAFFLGMLLYVLKAKDVLPSLLSGGVSVLGSMTTPLSMIILGARSGAEPLNKLAGNRYALGATALKLVAFPLLCCAVLWFIPMDSVLRFSLMLLSGAPSASIVSSMAELHHTEQNTAADCVLISTLLSVVTLPLLSMLVSLSL